MNILTTKTKRRCSLLMVFAMLLSLVMPGYTGYAEETTEQEEIKPYYTINYYKDEVKEENLINSDGPVIVYQASGDAETIKVSKIDEKVRDEKKPDASKKETWDDGIFVSGDGTPLSEDATVTFKSENADSLNVVYKSKPIPGYTVNYYKNSVDKDNFIDSEYFVGNDKDPIDIKKIELNKFKPKEDDKYDWEDGVIEEGYPEVIESNKAEINVIYKSIDVVTYQICYYKNSVDATNLIKSVDVRGHLGDKVDVSKIDLNAEKPKKPKNYSWSDGKLQPGYEEILSKEKKTTINIIYDSALITYCDVTSLGANGYDALDDTAAIQKALDYSSANYDADYAITVYLPAGTYYISDTLFIQPNTTLMLSPYATIVRSSSAITKNMIRDTYNSKHFSLYKKNYNVAKNIHITGGTWDGGDITTASQTSNLIYIGHASNITIDNTTIRNCYGAHAIEFAGVKDSLISNCNITGFRYASNYFTSEAIQLDVCYKDKKDGEWTPGFELDKTPCQNVVIQNCIITDYPRGIGVHHTLKGYECSDITIRNNTFTRSSADTQGKSVAGLFLQGAKNINIENNFFDYYSYGAIIKTCTGLTITNNTFKYNNLGCLSMSGCDANNGIRTFTITDKTKLTTAQQKKWKKKFIFTAPGIKSGNFKINGKKYKFNTKSDQKKVTLKKKVKKKNVKVTFYGKDSWGNKYYQSQKTTQKYLLK